MDLKELRSFLGSDWEMTQERIKGALACDIELLNTTNAAILENSGKQLRPLLSLLIARAVSRQPLSRDSWGYAAAAELLHNATLLHDDVADESDERRGRPTINSLMGPSVSVLVGDYWLVRAVECVLDADTYSAEVIRVFARTLSNLAEGEMFQLQKAQSVDTNEADYLRIIYNKTATLFEAAAISAVIGVGGSKEVQQSMTDFARNLGLAFQIRDDIFDYSLGMNIGKPVGADILERKITMPLLGAFLSAGKDEEDKVRKMIMEIENHPESRDAIVDFVIRNNGLEYAQKRLEEFTAEALKSLDVLGDSREKSYLQEIAHYVGARKI